MLANEDLRALPGTPGAAGTRAWFENPDPWACSSKKDARRRDPARCHDIGDGDGSPGYATFPQISAGSHDDGGRHRLSL